ncbi:GMP/IMP nucleotidase [Serratia ureilytica]
MVPEFDWPQIDTVLLDMDGTLLDLEFDSHFWLSLVPQALSERRTIPFDEARNIIEREYQAVQHTMNWYCFDYWSERLDLDIYRMTSEVGSRARLREDTEPFLQALRDAGLQTILLTNAHPHSLAVKIEHTGLDRHLDLLFSTHTFGYPKEDQRLWQAAAHRIQSAAHAVRRRRRADPRRGTRFRHSLLPGVQNPDSSTAEKLPAPSVDARLSPADTGAGQGEA